jgi:hypothetical protein
VPSKVSLFVSGQEFITNLQTSKILPKDFTTNSKTPIGPFKLIPKRMPRTCFEKEKTEVKGYIQLGTGYNGEPAISQGRKKCFCLPLFSSPYPPFSLS